MPEVEIFTLVDNTAVIEKLLLADQLDLGLVEALSILRTCARTCSATTT